MLQQIDHEGICEDKMKSNMNETTKRNKRSTENQQGLNASKGSQGLLARLRDHEVIRYAIVGALTTAVGYGSFWLLVYPMQLNENIGNFTSIHLAILFAYWANRSYVFSSRAEGWLGIFKEFSAFYAARWFTVLLELLGVFLLATLLAFDAMLSKLSISILVVVVNYFLSKYWVFKGGSTS